MHVVWWLAPVLTALAATIAAACITTGSRIRRTVGVGVGMLPLLTAWFLPNELELGRGVLGLVSFIGTMRVVDLSRGEWPLTARLRHVLSVVDSRRLIRRAPGLDGVAFAQALSWIAVSALAIFGLKLAEHAHGAWFWLARYGAGLVLFYALVAALYLLVAAGYRAIGFDTPPLHVAPYRSRSVQELWGERWARPISEWLGDTFFRPFARRRRPLTGIVLAFAVSAAFHAYAVWVALGFVRGLGMAAMTFAYFMLQGAVMLLERALCVRSFRPALGHAWTVGWLLGLAPLFIEPNLTALGFPRTP